MKSSDNSVKDTEAKLPVGNQKMLAEQHKNKKLTISRSVVGSGLIICQFWQPLPPCGAAWAAEPKMIVKQNGISIIHNQRRFNEYSSFQRQQIFL